MTTFVFGYGSLVNRGSLARGLQRPVTDADLRPATLVGHARIWGASEVVVCEARPGQPLHARFLDLVEDAAATVNGVAVRVSDAERKSLEIREKSYIAIDVTGRVDGLPEGARCVAFASAPEAIFPGDVVLAEYVRLVEAGFSALGPGELATFRRTTVPVTIPLLAGNYRFVDPEQNQRTTRGEPEAA